jgi:hypothetical protein
VKSGDRGHFIAGSWTRKRRKAAIFTGIALPSAVLGASRSIYLSYGD